MAALHAALGRGEVEALAAARAPMDADFDALYGPEPQEEKDRFQQALRRARLQPLGALSLRPIGDGRRVLVRSGQADAPIRCLGEGDDAGWRMDAGTIWAKLGGEWKIVR